MADWLSNPVFWAICGVGIALLVVVIKAFFWAGKVDKHMTTVDAFMGEIRTDIKDILGRLAPATVTTGSPTALTDLGRSVSQMLGASEWAERHATKLASRTGGMLAYDIEEMAFQYVKEEFIPDDEMEAKIKQGAYENGIKRDKVLDVLAVELRDALLSNEHEE